MYGRTGVDVQKYVDLEEASRPEPEPAPTLYQQMEDVIVKMPWRKFRLVTTENVHAQVTILPIIKQFGFSYQHQQGW